MAKKLKTLVAALTLLTFGTGSAIAHGYNDIGSLFSGKYPPTSKQVNLAVSQPAPWGPVAVLSDRTFVKTDGPDGKGKSVVEFDYDTKGSLDRVTLNTSSGIFVYTGNAITQQQKTDGDSLRLNYVQEEAANIENAFKNDAGILHFYDRFDLFPGNGQDSANIGRAIFGFNGNNYVFLLSRIHGENAFSLESFSEGVDSPIVSKHIDLKNITKSSPLYMPLENLAKRINEQQDSYFPPMPSF